MTNASFDLSAPRTSALFLLAASAGSLLAAFFFQYVIGFSLACCASGSAGPTPS